MLLSRANAPTEAAAGKRKQGAGRLTVDAWLASLPRPLPQYAGTLSRNGFTHTFALALLADAGPLIEMGLWRDDAEYIFDQLRPLRATVAEWTPHLATLSMRVPVFTWLASLPIPLSHHTDGLKEIGYDAVSVFPFVEKADLALVNPPIPSGHQDVIVYCGRQLPPMPYTPSAQALQTDLGLWLSQLAPPLDHYKATLELDGIVTVADLCQVTRNGFERFLMRPGHRRALWHFVALVRTHTLRLLP
jgi:hypothetical protein